MNRKLEVNPKALDVVKHKCEEYACVRQLPIPELTPPRVKMATLPEGTEPIDNPVGSAPGVQVNLAESVLFVLPGVPSEMEAIFTQTIAPKLKQAVGDMVFCEKSLFLSKVLEANLAPLIDKVMTDNRGVYIKSHPLPSKMPHIEIHLTTSAKAEDKPDEMLNKARAELAALVKQNGGEATTEQ